MFQDNFLLSSVWILVLAVLLVAYSRVRGRYKRQRRRLMKERQKRWEKMGDFERIPDDHHPDSPE